jgi:hypothetical protein
VSAKPLASPRGRLYDEDFLVWTQETARLLRARRLHQIDVEHVAEEIEDMGLSQKRELLSRLRTIILHLLKWSYQPGKRKGGWATTVDTQRAELETLLRHSPSLRRAVPESIQEVYPRAVGGASRETGLSRNTFPDRCPFTPEQILDEDFLPE